MYWSQPPLRRADSTSWKQAAVPTTSIRLTIDAVVILRTKNRAAKDTILVGSGKVDISVVEIGGRKYAYSRLIPKGQLTNVVLLADSMINNENCDKIEKKAMHTVVHNILHRTYHWHRSLKGEHDFFLSRFL